MYLIIICSRQQVQSRQAVCNNRVGHRGWVCEETLLSSYYKYISTENGDEAFAERL